MLGERHPDYADSLNNLADLLESQGDYAAARPLYEQALAIRKEVLGERHPDYATSLNNLADLLESQGDYAAARPLYEQALAIRKEVLGERHPDYANSLTNLAFLLWAQRDYAARGPAPEASPRDRPGQPRPGRRRPVRAPATGHGTATCAGNSMPTSRWRRWPSSLPGTPTAMCLPPRAPSLRSSGGSASSGGGSRPIPGPRPPSASPTTSRRSSNWRPWLWPRPIPSRPRPGETKIADLARRTDELEAELARLDAGFRAERAEASRTPEQLQAALPPGTALVDLLVYTAYQPPAQGKGKFQTERRLVAFVVRPDRPIARVDLGPIAPILKAIDEWRPLLVGGKTAPAASDPAQTLRRLIWEPVEPHLEGIASVLVSPDGALGLVPLAALPGKEPSRYLIEERSIAVVPVPRMLGSATTIAAQAQGSRAAQPEPVPSLLLAGDIDYGGDPGTGADRGASRSAAVGTRAGLLPDFKALRDTRGEILEVRDSFEGHFPDAAAQVLRGDKATEEAFRRQAPRSRYLHLATHGYFAPPELRSALGPDDLKAAKAGIDALGGAGVAGYHPGLLSGIAMAGANRRPTPIGQDDGILTAMEVAELDLSGVELAVLSACETGLGEVAGGEGLLGLQRAFQVAGARSVVASLWTIGDEPTRALMSRFYENLWRKGQPPAEALREAQLSMLRGSLWRGTAEAGDRRAEVGPAAAALLGRIRPEHRPALSSGRDRPFSGPPEPCFAVTLFCRPEGAETGKPRATPWGS